MRFHYAKPNVYKQLDMTLSDKDQEFASAVTYLGKNVLLTIDRPLASRHPKYKFRYPLNYGFVPNTLAPDGEELDAYVLGINEPLQSFNGRCVAYIHRLDDADDKLIVVPEGMQFSDEEIRRLTFFQEQFFTSEIIR